MCGSRRKALSGLEGVLAVMRLEVTMEATRTGTVSDSSGRQFHISWAATKRRFKE